MDGLPSIDRAGSVRLIPPLPETGTIMTGVMGAYEHFLLYIEEYVLKLDLVSSNQSLLEQLNIDQRLDNSTSYQIDFQIETDHVELVLATVSGSEIETLSRNLTTPTANGFFVTICVGGAMLELPYYEGTLERVIFNRVTLSDQNNTEQATVESRANLIHLVNITNPPPLRFERLNLASYRRISFEMRMQQDNGISGAPISSSNPEVELAFIVFNNKLILFSSTGFFVSCPSEQPVIDDNIWHHVDLTLLRNGDGTANFRLIVDDQPSHACEITNSEEQMEFGILLESLISSSAPLDFGAPKAIVGSPRLVNYIGCFRNLEFRQEVDCPPVQPNLDSVIRLGERFSEKGCQDCSETDMISCPGGDVCTNCGFNMTSQCQDPENVCQGEWNSSVVC